MEVETDGFHFAPESPDSEDSATNVINYNLKLPCLKCHRPFNLLFLHSIVNNRSVATVRRVAGGAVRLPKDTRAEPELFQRRTSMTHTREAPNLTGEPIRGIRIGVKHCAALMLNPAQGNKRKIIGWKKHAIHGFPFPCLTSRGHQRTPAWSQKGSLLNSTFPTPVFLSFFRLAPSPSCTQSGFHAKWRTAA